MVSFRRVDAAADAIVSLVDYTARPFLVSLHQTSEAVRRLVENDAFLISLRGVDASTDAMVSLNEFARPLLVSLHQTSNAVRRLVENEVTRIIQLAATLMAVMAIITFFGFRKGITTGERVRNTIEEVGVTTKTRAELQHSRTINVADFAIHVLDFAELMASKGYNIILVYHPSNAWHGAASRNLKDAGRGNWGLLQFNAQFGVTFYDNPKKLVDRIRQGDKPPTTKKEGKKLTAIIFPGNQTTLISHFYEVPSGLGPVHLYGQTDEYGIPFTWLPSEMTIDGKSISSQSGTVFSLGVRSDKGEGYAQTMFDSDGERTNKDSGAVHAV